MKILMIGVILLLLSCKKDELEVPLQELDPCNLSPLTFKVIEELKRHPATVVIDSFHVYKLTIRSSHFPDGMLRPCNLPKEFWKNNLQIYVTGSIYGLVNAQGQALPLELKSIEVRG